MAILTRDPETTAAQLGEWPGQRFGDRGGATVADVGVPPGSGFSGETLLLDATWGDGGSDRLVVRVAPTVHAIFWEPDFEGQYRVMAALDAHTDVPMPEMLAYEGDERWLGARRPHRQPAVPRLRVRGRPRLGDGGPRRPALRPGVMEVRRPPPREMRGLERLTGFASYEETLARWAERTGRTVDPALLDFYEVFGGMRFAIVMVRLADLLVEIGLLPDAGDMATNNIITHLLARILDLPAPGELVIY